MAYAAQQRNKDHWSMRLRVKRPGGVHPVALVLALIQTLLLAATASSLATGGGLYGCVSACGTADEPVTPLLAIVLGVAMLVAPLLIGAFCNDWRLAIGLAVLPIFPALIIASNTLLTPTNTIVPPQPPNDPLPVATTETAMSDTREAPAHPPASAQTTVLAQQEPLSNAPIYLLAAVALLLVALILGWLYVSSLRYVPRPSLISRSLEKEKK